MARASRRWRAAIALSFALPFALTAACGPNPHVDTHARAINLQALCCENLDGSERDRCLAEIPRVGNPQVAWHPTTRRTYECVADHFVCDPATGRPTQPSAQAQLVCLQEQEPPQLQGPGAAPDQLQSPGAAPGA